jgi:MFS transporter, ACS family, allantoate permease
MSDIEKDNVNVNVELHSTFSKENIDTHQVLSHVVSIDGRIVDITGDVDEAMKYALDAEDVELTPEENKTLLRRIDIFLLPLICLLYSLQFMDKVSSGYAAIMGLRTYFNMQGDQYSWTGSAFYLGYLAFEFPISMLLQRFPVAKVASTFVIVWGVILCLHATPSNYAGFTTLRTLLGAFESAITPAMVIITGQWYRADEQFLRTAFWFSCNGFGTILGSSIAYGLATRADQYTMEAWKVLFIVVGCMTISVGFMILFHVPDIPVKAWFLNDVQKKQVVIRIKSNNQGFGNKHFKVHQLKEALLDINTWFYFLFALAADIPNGALTNFGSILLKDSFGYSSLNSLLMNMPGGAVELVGCILFALTQKYFKHKLAIAAFAMLVTTVSACMLAFATESPNARLAGYYLMSLSPVGMICCLSCFTSNVAGHTKKITVNALYLIGYCVGNLIGPQTFIASQAPNYTGGQISMVVCYAASIFFILCLYFNYWRENRRRDKMLAEGLIEIPHIENIEFADLTDKENVKFRYQL